MNYSSEKRFRCRLGSAGLLLMVLALSANESAARENLFGGGMAAFFQYANVNTDYGTQKGLAWGLGGRLHFYLGKLARIGSMGSTWRLSYDTPGLKGSYRTMGYGGLTAEVTHRIRSSRLSAGLLAGGGRVTNLHVVSHDEADTISACYVSPTTSVFMPMITYEYSLTKAISLMVMMDYLMGSEMGKEVGLGSPGVRVGVLFNR